MRIPGLLAMAALVALSTASCGFETIEHRQCPTGGTTDTYDNFGRRFMDDYCQSCHGSTSTNRQGAPGEFIFDTRAQVQHWAARIYARSAIHQLVRTMVSARNPEPIFLTTRSDGGQKANSARKVLC